jgi:hypothetical protein
MGLYFPKIETDAHEDSMKKILALSALFLLVSGPALAGNGYDTCIKEEKALKVREKGDCSGMSYLLNPSGCFATRRIIKEYAAGKCRRIGETENIDFSAKPAAPESRGSGPAGYVKETDTPGSKIVETVSTVPASQAEALTVPQKVSLEQLKEENSRLKAEIIRLREENEGLRKTGP